MAYLEIFDTASKVSMNFAPNVVLVKDTGKVAYNVPIGGIYIQHIDGTLYTEQQWIDCGFSKDEANGVAVVDYYAKFVIAKSDIEKKPWSSNTSTYISGVGGSTSGSNIDYKGKSNTDKIIESDTSGAAYNCSIFVFPNGDKGYLPSCGEMALIARNRGKVKSAISTIGGEHFSDEDYWTSTQTYTTSAATINIKSNTIYKNTTKSSMYRSRAVTPLQLIK